MKILMISYNPTKRGTYFRAFELARELFRFDQSVTLLSTAHRRRTGVQAWEENGVKIVEFPALFRRAPRSGWDPYNIITRLTWLKGKEFDIVHGFESRPSVIYPALHLTRDGTPLVLDWCDWFGKGGSVEERPNKLFRFFLRPFETFFENHFRTRADATTVICNTLFQRALDLGVGKKSLTCIPNGFNMPGWDNKIEKSFARKVYCFSHQHFVIGYVGSLFPKDAELMAKAFAEVHQQLPNARLLHLGQSNYQVNTIGPLRQAITVTGNIDENKLQTGLAACDICWLPMVDIPANQGRFPLKFTNYLAAARPMIVTDVGDIPKIVIKFGVGLTCNPTAKSLAEATLRMASNPNTVRAFGTAAEELSHNPQHSWRNRAKKLLEVYQKVK